MLREILKENGLDELVRQCEELGIKIREDQSCSGDTLFNFKYSQIDSPKTHPLVIESRGVVVSEKLNEVVCQPFNRFFNVDEQQNQVFDWDDFTAYEKADGSIIKLYWYDGFWEVGTSGTSTGDTTGNNVDWTFREKFIKTLGYESEYDFQANASSAFTEGLTYLFELVAKDNRIVTPYDEDTCILLSVFRTETGVEFTEEQIADEFYCMNVEYLNVRLPETIKGLTKETLFEKVKNLKDLKEGFVVKDKNGNRLKIKSTAYVTAHHVRGELGMTKRKAINLVLSGEHEEYISYFPEDKEAIDNIIDSISSIYKESTKKYGEIMSTNPVSKRDFAILAKDFKYSFLLFKAWDGKSIMKEIMATSVKNLEEML